MPVAALVLGIVLVGAVFLRNLNRPAQTTAGQNAENANVAARCGDGICQSVACLSTNCPPPENETNCPQDCTVEPEPTATNSSLNGNTNATTSSALNYSVAAQSLAEQNDCPLQESNLSPSDAVSIAARTGLGQGAGTVAVRLYRYDEKPEECVWSIRNEESDHGGREVIIIDATQEVLRNSTWKSEVGPP